MPVPAGYRQADRQLQRPIEPGLRQSTQSRGVGRN